MENREFLMWLKGFLQGKEELKKPDVIILNAFLKRQLEKDKEKTIKPSTGPR